MKLSAMRFSLVAIAMAALTACGGGDGGDKEKPVDGDKTYLLIGSADKVTVNFSDDSATAKIGENEFVFTFNEEGDVVWQMDGESASGRVFDDGAAFVACAPEATEQNTNILLLDSAEKANFTDLKGKSFTGFSCGELEGGDTINLSDDASVAEMGGEKLVLEALDDLFGEDGLDIGDRNIKATVYKLGGYHYVVAEDSVDGEKESRMIYVQDDLLE